MTRYTATALAWPRRWRGEERGCDCHCGSTRSCASCNRSRAQQRHHQQRPSASLYSWTCGTLCQGTPEQPRAVLLACHPAELHLLLATVPKAAEKFSSVKPQVSSTNPPPRSYVACISDERGTSVPHVPRLKRINLRSCKSYYYTVLFSLFSTVPNILSLVPSGVHRVSL